VIRNRTYVQEAPGVTEFDIRAVRAAVDNPGVELGDIITHPANILIRVGSNCRYKTV
jgi:hypothetical protein